MKKHKKYLQDNKEMDDGVGKEKIQNRDKQQ